MLEPGDRVIFTDDCRDYTGKTKARKGEVGEVIRGPDKFDRCIVQAEREYLVHGVHVSIIEKTNK